MSMRSDPTSSGNGYATPPLALQTELGRLVDGYALGGWYAGELKPLDVAAALRRAGIAPDEFHAAIQFATAGAGGAGAPDPAPFLVWRDADTGVVHAARAAEYAGAGNPSPNGARPDRELTAAAVSRRRRGDAGRAYTGDPINGRPVPPAPLRPDGLPADAVPVSPDPDVPDPESDPDLIKSDKPPGRPKAAPAPAPAPPAPPAPPPTPPPPPEA